MLLSPSAASHLADKFLSAVTVSALPAALPKIESPSPLFAGAHAPQTLYPPPSVTAISSPPHLLRPIRLPVKLYQPSLNYLKWKYY